MHPEAPGWDELVSRVMRGENDFARQTMAAFCALLAVMAVYALSWLAASLWLSKRL